MSDENFSFTGNDGTEVEVTLTPKLKAFIEDTYESGYDPEKIVRDEAQSSLLLPESCMPKAQEFIHMEPALPLELVRERLTNMVLDSKPGDVLVFDFHSPDWIGECERILSSMKGWMGERNVTFRLTPRMMESVRDLQQKLWAVRAS
jgi:hypothetical protein